MYKGKKCFYLLFFGIQDIMIDEQLYLTAHHKVLIKKGNYMKLDWEIITNNKYILVLGLFKIIDSDIALSMQ